MRDPVSDGGIVIPTRVDHVFLVTAVFLATARSCQHQDMSLLLGSETRILPVPACERWTRRSEALVSIRATYRWVGAASAEAPSAGIRAHYGAQTGDLPNGRQRECAGDEKRTALKSCERYGWEPPERR
jgi:hypothetical protein